MLIRSLSVKNLHGYLTRTIRFKTGVNILTGINGSGKTSYLNALAWTLSPSAIHGNDLAAYRLSTLEFDEIKIVYSEPGSGKRGRSQVRALRNEEVIEITVTGVEGSLRLPVSFPAPRTAYARSLTHPINDEEEIFAHLLERERSNAVLEKLTSLIGPLYLPLDRRWSDSSEQRVDRYLARRSSSRPLTSNVLELPERAYRQEQTEVANENDRLRQQIITSFFEESEYFSPQLGQVWTVDEVQQNQETIVGALTQAGIPDAHEVTTSYFQKLSEIAEQIGGKKWTRGRNADDPQWPNWIDWINISPLTGRVKSILQIVTEYEQKVLKLTERTRRFIGSADSFLSDSNKVIYFNSQGEIRIRVRNSHEIRASSLSSGELQLLTLFSFLYFQFDPDQQFPIIIDEPELSLHLEWQGRYLQSITAANPDAQFILATHSPEITAPFEDRCIDVSPVK